MRGTESELSKPLYPLSLPGEHEKEAPCFLSRSEAVYLNLGVPLLHFLALDKYFF
jgi:hypothetical protein